MKKIIVQGLVTCRSRFLSAAAAILVIGGCSPSAPTPSAGGPPWDLAGAEAVTWVSDDPSFAQDFAIEASGMAASGPLLYIPSEKYSRLLVFDPESGNRVGVVRLDVPLHTELEGVAVTDDGFLFCDEAHAAVYELAPAGQQVVDAASGGLPVEVRKLTLEGVSVQGGKIGFEGIEEDPVTGEVIVLLERSGTEETGCVSRLYRLRREDFALVSHGDPVEVQLEDCAWRLTGLTWWENRLLALKTQFPGERYEIVSVDLDSGDTEVVLELTDLLRALEGRGWSNNVEGLAISDDGALWMVADNAVTGVIDDPLPPAIDVRTLLLRVPAVTDR